MVCKTVNAVSQSGNYWIANNFIWDWLLIPVTALGEVIRSDCKDGYKNLHRVTVPIRTRSNVQKTHIYFVKASYNISLYYLTAFPCICTFLRISDLKPNYFFVFRGGGTQEYRAYFKFRQHRKTEKESV